MQRQSDIIAFLHETIARMSAKSPAFFQVYQNIGLAAFCVGFIPDILNWLEIVPQGKVAIAIALAVKVAGGVMWFMSKQPVTDPRKPVDKNGEELSKHEVMPFTQKKKEEAQVIAISQQQQNQGA